MAIWYRAIVGTRSSWSLSRLKGRLADGIVFVPITQDDLNELRGILDILPLGYEYAYVLLVRVDVVAKPAKKDVKKAYFNLLRMVTVMIRIAVDPDAFIIKTLDVDKTKIEMEEPYRWNNIYSDAWPKLHNVFMDYKTTFELFSAATVTDRTDNTYNVLNSVISLESLLLNGEKAENAYKFRLRGAFLLSSSSYEREIMYKFLKLAYEYRSTVVHSNDAARRKLRKKFKDEFGLTIYDVNEELIKINRYILKLFLNNNEILSELDKIILTTGYSSKDESYSNKRMLTKLKARGKFYKAQARLKETKK